jgi:microcystin-dependent protein
MAIFEETHPIAFQFLADKGETPVLFIEDPTIVDADDDTEGIQTLRIRLTNVSSHTVELVQPAGAGPPNPHFSLLFRPATLSAKAVKSLRITPRTWSGGVRTAADGTVSIVLLNVRPPLLPPGDSIDINLVNVSADAREGARHTNVELQYGNLRFQDTTTFLSGSRTRRLQILNPPTNRKLPLHIGFAGGNRVLNDGLTENSLKLGFTNTLAEESIRFVPDTLPAATRITMSFDIAPDTGSNMDWAIGTETDMKDVSITPVGSTPWRVIEPSGEAGSQVWLLTPDLDITLAPGASFQFSIDGIRSSTPTGPANLYLSFENIPGFLDQDIILVMEKAPVIYSGLNVGIGLIPPLTVLPDPLPDGNIPPPPVAGTGNLLLHGTLFDSLDGGGTVKWKDNRLSWNGTFMAFGNHPIPSQQAGIALRIGDTLYAELGSAVTFKTRSAGSSDPVLSNWVLIAQITAGNRARLSNGVTLPPNGQSTDGSPVLRGTVIMWSGSAADIPDGWVVCDGTGLSDGFPTPDLRGRFIAGFDPVNAEYQLGRNEIGKEKVQLTVAELPQHNHTGATFLTPDHSHSVVGRFTDTGGTHLENLSLIVSSSPSFTDTHPQSMSTNNAGGHSHQLNMDGGDQAHENRPPYYVLVFLMKV